MNFNFIKIFAATFFLLFFLLINFNFHVDSYSIFSNHGNEFEASYEPNTRFIKTEYLNNNCNLYDTYIFGSSRAASYKTEFVNNELDALSYNFSVSDESVVGIFNKLEWLVRKGCSPKNIIIAISPDRLYTVRDYTKRPYTSLLRMEHPQIANNLKYSFDFATNFLYSRQISSINFINLMNYKHKKKQFRYNIKTGDVYYLWDHKFPIKKCINSDQKFNRNVLNQISETLINIKLFAQKHDIQVYLMLNPQPYDSFGINAESLVILLKSISRYFDSIHRIPFYDQRLFDDNYYHDHGHPKDILARDVISSKSKIKTTALIDEIENANFSCDEKK